ncbi:hypothetical protein MAIT1_04742 [Magnetofaba australis IT-1]|uniref:Uncharacterized protein n=2 Tax=Magnetofaba TaxID=1472292 RepID=A0A1Y2KAX4_9PROT|nr:hypothetical protein MAIT1_04742 [Magnetofaba australis IT-1]
MATTILGSIRRDMEQDLRNLNRAVVDGTRDAGRGLKQDLREQVISAGLGNRLARTWRDRSYPNQGINAASLVWSKAPHIVQAFDRGVVIRGRNSRWLAIPTPQAPKRGVDGKKIHPGNFPESRFGKLRFVYRPGRSSLLVVDGVRISAKTGRVGRQAKGGIYTKSGRLKSGVTAVVMFVMVPQVRLRKRLDVKRVATRWATRLPEAIDDNWRGSPATTR